MKKIIIAAYLLAINALHLKIASADITGETPQVNVSDLPNPLGGGVNDIGTLIQRIISIATLYVAAPVATLMIIIGAFQILSAGGDPKKFETGKKTITYALVGFAILFLAYLFINLVKELLGVQ